MLYATDEREVAESPKEQGVNETRAYSFDFTSAGVTTIEGTPTVAIYQRSDDALTDVSATKLTSGTPTVAGLVVSSVRKVQALADGVEYLLFCRVTHDGAQVSELFCRLFGKA